MEADNTQQAKRSVNQKQSQSGKNGKITKGDTQNKGSIPGQSQNQNQKQKQKQQQHQQDGIPVIPHKDLFQRINFSYQAALFLQSLGSSQGQTSSSSSSSKSGSGSGHEDYSYPSDVQIKMDRKGKRKAIESEIEFPPCVKDNHGGVITQTQGGVDIGTKKKFRQLARMNMREMNHMSVHNQLKLDPSLKRSLCKTCNTVLIPGLTSRMRNRPNRNSFFITHHTCLTCNSALSIPAPPIPIPVPIFLTSPNAGPSSDKEMRYEVDREGLDGKNRKTKRQKASKRGKRIFHEIEKAPGDEGGHTLWKGDEKLEGWGVKMNNA